MPADFVELEKKNPGSQKRFPSNSGCDGKFFLWGQAVYIIAKLLGKKLRKFSQVLTYPQMKGIYFVDVFLESEQIHIGFSFDWTVDDMV